jgi:hypothetical protein
MRHSSELGAVWLQKLLGVKQEIFARIITEAISSNHSQVYSDPYALNPLNSKKRSVRAG